MAGYFPRRRKQLKLLGYPAMNARFFDNLTNLHLWWWQAGTERTARH
jgi:hypothetical protein